MKQTQSTESMTHRLAHQLAHELAVTRSLLPNFARPLMTDGDPGDECGDECRRDNSLKQKTSFLRYSPKRSQYRGIDSPQYRDVDSIHPSKTLLPLEKAWEVAP
jgi:hypothetical protein